MSTYVLHNYIVLQQMSRKARELSNSWFYHIMFRGINLQNLFEEEADFDYMLETLEKVKGMRCLQI